MTKYEGRWDKDRKHGDGMAVFKDGSTFNGSFKKDFMDGSGKFDWAIGHSFEGQWKESQMDGQGSFTHMNGRTLSGLFKRNYFLQDKCFINPLEDEKAQKKTMKIYDEQVL